MPIKGWFVSFIMVETGEFSDKKSRLSMDARFFFSRSVSVFNGSYSSIQVPISNKRALSLSGFVGSFFSEVLIGYRVFVCVHTLRE